MLRFRCPKCNNPVAVDDEQAATGYASCECGQRVRLPENLQPTPATQRAPAEVLTAIQTDAATPLRLDPREQGPDYVIDGEDDYLDAPRVARTDGENYQDFNRYREKPRRRRRRDRRDLPTASLLLDWVTPFTVSLVVLCLLSGVLGLFGLFIQGPEIGLFVLGGLVFFVGWLWFLVYMVQDGEYLLCMLVPGYAILYALRNLDTAGKAVLFQFLGVGILITAGMVAAVPGRRAVAFGPAPPPPPPPVAFGPGGFAPPIPFGPDGGVGEGGFVPKERRPVGVQEPPSAKELGGLLGYWSLDDGQGQQALDDSGKGVDAKVRGEWIRGVRGGALWLKEQGDALDYGDSPKFNFAADAPFTFCGWVQTQARDGTIWSQRNSDNSSPVIDILVKDGKIAFQVRDDRDEGRPPAEVVGGAIDDGEWHHFACARTKTGELMLYLDGELQKNGGNANCRGAITTDWRTVGVESYWVKKGVAMGQPYLSGCVDEVCVFGRELPLDDVRKLAGR
jgi:hypothetical protein